MYGKVIHEMIYVLWYLLYSMVLQGAIKNSMDNYLGILEGVKIYICIFNLLENHCCNEWLKYKRRVCLRSPSVYIDNTVRRSVHCWVSHLRRTGALLVWCSDIGSLPLTKLAQKMWPIKWKLHKGILHVPWWYVDTMLEIHLCSLK